MNSTIIEPKGFEIIELVFLSIYIVVGLVVFFKYKAHRSAYVWTLITIPLTICITFWSDSLKIYYEKINSKITCEIMEQPQTNIQKFVRWKISFPMAERTPAQRLIFIARSGLHFEGNVNHSGKMQTIERYIELSNQGKIRTFGGLEFSFDHSKLKTLEFEITTTSDNYIGSKSCENFAYTFF